MGLVKTIAIAVCAVATALAQTATYEQNFEAAEAGSIPKEFLVLDGGFKVVQDGANKFLELPEAPLDTFGVLFGPTEKENRTASARVFSTGKGRRFPTFSVGVGGVGGYKLQVSPAKKAVELYKGDEVKATAPYDWKSGTWTRLSVTIKKVKDSEWRVEGRVWGDDAKAPADALVTWTETEAPPSGRASIGGSPYATTPIRYDDLVSAPAQ
jgi:hypothetical protein